ncbi:hypothetical protein ATCC90586_010404 [Pythium insidiosum]|nr:hypothetical protein ATCC90586_010404 [Pythium insidiosum]
MSALTFRSRILDAESSGYRPRAQLELVLRSSLGAVLCKPQWWLKWRGSLPAKRFDDGETVRPVADKWLDEITTLALQNRFFWMTKHWRRWYSYALDEYRRKVLQALVGFPFEGASDRELKIQQFRQDARTAIAFELWWCPEKWPKDAFEKVSARFGVWGCPRTEDELTQGLVHFEHEVQTCRFFGNDRFRQMSEQLESMSVLCWYFGVLAFSQRVKQHRDGDWPEDVDLDLADEAVRQRAIGLIAAAHSGSVTKETFSAIYPDADARPEAVALVWFHVERAVEQVMKIRACARSTLDQLIESNDLLNPASCKGFISPGPVIETWMSDSIVREDVKAVFLKCVAVLEDIPEDEKDWHPGSNNQVLDLVHPSLYCCVFGETKRVARRVENTAEDLSVADRMHRMIFSAAETIESDSGGATYQWIPSDFRVDTSGDVKILSYINNLHPVRHRESYECIESIFAGFVPLFDRVLSS